jgi:hypothetical protein
VLTPLGAQGYDQHLNIVMEDVEETLTKIGVDADGKEVKTVRRLLFLPAIFTPRVQFPLSKTTSPVLSFARCGWFCGAAVIYAG